MKEVANKNADSDDYLATYQHFELLNKLNKESQSVEFNSLEE